MTSKLWYLTKVSLKKKMGTKWFVVVNLLLAIAIVGIVNIDSVIQAFGGDFNRPLELYLLDETNESNEIFLQNMNALIEEEEDEKIEIKEVTKSLEEAKEDLEKEDQVLVVLKEDETNYLKAEVISCRKINSLSYQKIITAINNTKATYALAKSNIDPIELQKLAAQPEIKRVVLNDEKSVDEQMETVMSSIFPTLILPFFMLAIILVQMIGAEICEEKTTRSMEIIISNVSPKVHFISKILSSNIFVLSQGLLLILYAGLGVLLRGGSPVMSNTSSMGELVGSLWQTLEASGITSMLGYLIPLAIALILLSFLAYSLVSGILASMTVNMEDYQQILTPIMMVTMVGYFLAIMSGLFDGSIFIRILSYVPFLSALVSPALLLLGQIGIGDVIISIVVLGVFDFLLMKYGLRVYKEGILNYSTDKVWSKLRKAVKTK